MPSVPRPVSARPIKARKFAAIIYADRNGRIHTRTPMQAKDIRLFRITDFRALLVATRVIQTRARHARIGFSLFVPGVPEAENDDEAVSALIRWHDWVAAELARRLPAGSWKSLRNAA